MLQKEIESKLTEYIDPFLGKDLIAIKALKRMTIEANRIELDIVLGYPCHTQISSMQASLQSVLAPVVGGRQIDIKISSKIDAHVGKQGVSGLANIKNIIAIGSGKGGVGKSTVAVNLALALAQEGAEVGLLDADIYGPSQPTMLNATGERPTLKDGVLQPVRRHGIQSMSIGYLVDEHAPLVWRGPMLGKAMQQMLNDTNWEGLDYLIVDLPPGTGDIQLTLCQKMPVSGAIIVTTPQDLALVDVKRACEMFNKLNVPMLGVVENMSVFHCQECGHEERIFGEGGASKLAQQYQIDMLGAIPLNAQIRQMTDSGHPPVMQAPDSSYARLFHHIACKAAALLSLQPKDYSAKFPKIVVDK